LDPAGPLFEGYDTSVRLDKSDANYVDVIHSNGEAIYVGGFGIAEPIGHVDFYPNGGRAQRGCSNIVIGGLYDFIYCKNFFLRTCIAIKNSAISRNTLLVIKKMSILLEKH
jgi:hypothetical protein